LAEAYRHNDPMLWTRAQVDGAAEGKLVLQP
jgi:hypothetical protein